MYELVFLSGARAGVVIPAEGTLVAGRDTACGLEVPDPSVSRSHARFDWDGVRFQVEDTNSSNGTFVNERPIRQADVRDGDVVRLGNTRLRVQRVDSSGRPSDSNTMLFGFADASEPHLTHSLPIGRPDATRVSATVKRRDADALQRRLTSIMHVSELLAKIRDLDALFEPVLDALFELLPQTDRGFLLLGDSMENLTPRAMRERGRGRGAELRVSRSICRAALDQKQAYVYREGGDMPIDKCHSVVDLQIRSALAAPLMVGDETLGLIVLDTQNPSRAYDEDDLELAIAICHQVAIAIRGAQLVREVAAQSAARNNLMRFLPRALAEQAAAGEIDPGLGGRKSHCTVLFCDVIGFTARSERLPPEDLVASMNAYFNCVVPCVQQEGGSIDKFMGDAIMAVWGAFSDNRVAQSAVAAALLVHARLEAFNSRLEDPFRVGIGINSGDVIAGNIGAEERREYTVLGDTVNTAQRIETAAGPMQVLVSETTWSELDGTAFGFRMPELHVRNRVASVQTYSVRALAREHDEIQMLVPLRAGDHRAVLIRRLSDETFVLLHSLEAGLEDLEWSTDAVEWRGHDLGRVQIVTDLPSTQDGALHRSRVRLADPTAGGLLATPARDCDTSWDRMGRAS